jgi:hypothetical protein
MLLGRDSSVDIATRYGLDGPRIESQWGETFNTCPDRNWDRDRHLHNEYRVFFPGVQRPGRGFNPPSAEVIDKISLYLYPLTGSSWLVLR